jgi:hypothetical protein
VTFRQGTRRVRVMRRCTNGHVLMPGDRVRFWVGIVDGEFSPWEECITCVALDYGLPWLRQLPMPYRAEGVLAA